MLNSKKLMAKSILYIVIIVTSVLFFNCSKTYATREIQDSTLEIANRSENIVVAKCISADSRWNDEKSLIFTYITFQIDDTVKGDNTEDELTLRLLGGQVGDIIQSVPESPEFIEDEEVILFLGPENKSGYPTLTSVKNGVLRIETDSNTGQRVVTTPTTGIAIYKEDTNRSKNEKTNIFVEDLVYSLRRAIKK